MVDDAMKGDKIIGMVQPKENDTLEFRLEINELTQEVFVRVEEYTESDDLEESYQIWDNLLSQLKEIIGA